MSMKGDIEDSLLRHGNVPEPTDLHKLVTTLREIGIPHDIDAPPTDCKTITLRTGPYCMDINFDTDGKYQSLYGYE